MLRKFSNTRKLGDNIKLGILTAFSAGMVNIVSLIIFFAFTSNITGHYAILAEGITKGNWHQVGVVFAWIFLFFIGNFISNIIIINYNQKNAYLAHATPIFLEIFCLLMVGFYGQNFYRETLMETEVMIALMCFAMGIQNGLTASISNFVVKTTHLTGTTTDLAILFSMFTKKKYRDNPLLRGKALLLSSIAVSYVVGGVFAGYIYLHISFMVFYVVCLLLVVIVTYDFYNLKILLYLKAKKSEKLNDYAVYKLSRPEKKVLESETST